MSRQPAPFASINRSELVEMNDAVGDAVNGPIGGLGSKIVEHDHRGAVLREIVLERQDLAPVAQRALRQKTNLGQAVDHDALGLQPLNRLEYPLDRFAKLEIGGVKQTLVVVRIKYAFGRDELEYFNVVANVPAVRPCAVPEFLLGFGEADIHPDLVGRGACQQELQRDRGLSATGTAFQQMKAVAG